MSFRSGGREQKKSSRKDNWRSVDREIVMTVTPDKKMMNQQNSMILSFRKSQMMPQKMQTEGLVDSK
jgi:mevalonate pyrophosphate decarboxylase